MQTTFRFFLSILLAACLLSPYPARAEIPVYFMWSLEQNALKAYFGALSGSYLDWKEPLAHQADDGLCIDFAATGKPIGAMPSVGRGLYLDAGSGGGPCRVSNSEGSAVILTPQGKVVAAAMFWQACRTYQCGDDRHYLTIFLRNPTERPFAEPIFGHWAKEFMRCLAHPSPYGISWADTSNWALEPVQPGVPVNIVILRGYGARLIN